MSRLMQRLILNVFFFLHLDSHVPADRLLVSGKIRRMRACVNKHSKQQQAGVTYCILVTETRDNRQEERNGLRVSEENEQWAWQRHERNE